MKTYLTKTNIMALITIGTAIVSGFGIEIPTEIFIGEGSLLALFLRLGIIKLDNKL